MPLGHIVLVRVGNGCNCTWELAACPSLQRLSKRYNSPLDKTRRSKEPYDENATTRPRCHDHNECLRILLIDSGSD